MTTTSTENTTSLKRTIETLIKVCSIAKLNTNDYTKIPQICSVNVVEDKLILGIVVPGASKPIITSEFDSPFLCDIKMHAAMAGYLKEYGKLVFGANYAYQHILDLNNIHTSEDFCIQLNAMLDDEIRYYSNNMGGKNILRPVYCVSSNVMYMNPATADQDKQHLDQEVSLQYRNLAKQYEFPSGPKHASMLSMER